MKTNLLITVAMVSLAAVLVGMTLGLGMLVAD
jgi:hypothetical protein